MKNNECPPKAIITSPDVSFIQNSKMGGFQNPNQIEDAFIKKSATSISAFLLGSHKKKSLYPHPKRFKKIFQIPTALNLKTKILQIVYCTKSP